MLKLRLKRTGKKRSPSYRLVIMENLSRRDGRPIDEVGYYDPISKKCKFDCAIVKLIASEFKISAFSLYEMFNRFNAFYNFKQFKKSFF